MNHRSNAGSAPLERGVGRLMGERASACELEALRRQQAGERPTYSTGICGLITCGYGRLDWCGYWEFPLPGHEPPNEKVSG
jgi:hypothetical protein